MAIMIPSISQDFSPESREGEMFSSLQKLPDDYYVFHSFRIIKLEDNTWKENEIDFVIFNKDKGLLCLEAKAGDVYCERGIWHYGSGKEMRDPFAQANSNRWKLSKYMEEFYQTQEIKRHCKILSGVWFPGIDNNKLSRLALPSNAIREAVLTGDDLDNPLDSIERIFSIQVPVKVYGETSLVETSLTRSEVESLLQNVLCPTFNILPSKTLELDYKREKFNSLITEQCNLLNYLEEQRSAVINGAAGTGKTMIAIEKARRHANKGEKVLFLCFNVKLKEYLEKTYAYENVDYYTIDKFACKMCHSIEPNYDDLENELIRLAVDGGFPYLHIIIDEGQDFGQARMKSEEIFSTLEEIVLSTETGTFYVFYDKLQLVQSFNVPKFIENADCRLTLYKNCRNTKKIAETSFKPIGKTPKLFDFAIHGVLPEISFVSEEDIKERIDLIIKQANANGIKDIQILSCVPSGESMLESYLENDFYNYKGQKIPFTTCRKFKGLEADKIILVDVNKNAIMDNNKLFYVGSSRARFELSILATLSDSDCVEILQSLNSIVKKNNPQLTLSKVLGCKMI